METRRWSGKRMILLLCRRMFQPVDSEAPAACAHGSPEHHIPHLPLSAGLQHLVLPERGHLLHGQDSRLLALQLRVSTDILARRTCRPYTIIIICFSFIYFHSTWPCELYFACLGGGGALENYYCWFAWVELILELANMKAQKWLISTNCVNFLSILHALELTQRARWTQGFALRDSLLSSNFHSRFFPGW